MEYARVLKAPESFIQFYLFIKILYAFIYLKFYMHLLLITF